LFGFVTGWFFYHLSQYVVVHYWRRQPRYVAITKAALQELYGNPASKPPTRKGEEATTPE